MTEDKWIELLERIDRQFTMLDRTIEDVPNGPGEIETVIFQAPMGVMKVERTVRPVVLDRKQHFTNRAGGGASTEYIYSDTEKSDRMKVYRQNPRTEEWEEVDDAALAPRG